MPNQRYKLTIAYRGTAYHGWQRQVAVMTWKGSEARGEDIPTIQGVLASAISGVVGHPVNLVGSSRTDAGVHAKAQLAHFDTHMLQIPPEGMRRAINHRLPADILIRRIEPVADSFDAITSTLRKRYQYFIWNALDRPLFFPDLAWHRWQELDIVAMTEAAGHFRGTRDFASFARPGHGRIHTVRTLHACEISYRAPRLVIGIEGSGFLWQMVRIMVGTLVEVGLRRYPPMRVAEMLEARHRAAAGPTAPPEGLYLQWIQTEKKKLATDYPARPRRNQIRRNINRGYRG